MNPAGVATMTGGFLWVTIPVAIGGSRNQPTRNGSIRESNRQTVEENEGLFTVIANG